MAKKISLKEYKNSPAFPLTFPEPTTQFAERGMSRLEFFTACALGANDGTEGSAGTYAVKAAHIALETLYKEIKP